MRPQPKPKSTFSPKPPPIVQLWILRALVLLGGLKNLAEGDDLPSRQLASNVGIVSPVDENFSSSGFRSDFTKRHFETEQRADRLRLPSRLARNLAILGRTIGLTHADQQIIGFVALLHTEPSLDEAVTLLGPLSLNRISKCLAILLDLNETSVRDVLTSRSALGVSCLLAIDQSESSILRVKLDFVSRRFADKIVTSRADPIELLNDIILKADPPTLDTTSYGHIGESVAIARSYLRDACKARRCGVNILVYGAPGTGKSQFARVLAADLERNLFEISSEDEDRDFFGGECRLRAYRAAQSILSRSDAILLFDEADDILTRFDGLFSSRDPAASRKGWINRTLETNPVPTIWILNACHGIDPAFVRRFDVVVEMPVPPRCQREEIIRNASGGRVSDRTIRILSECHDLTPAVIAKAAFVAGRIAHKISDQTPDRTFCHLIDGTLKAQGLRPPIKSMPVCDLPRYDPTIVNAGINIGELVEGLRSGHGARLCLYGPPGTGKTSFGQWLAEELNMPLLLRRASDLMSMWVGENERNIARAFSEAETGWAVLLIDEVDSLLTDRHGSEHGWEVRLINEMLAQMECFSGILLATTNRFDALDQASMRRFDLKLEFRYLTFEQSLMHLLEYCRVLRLKEPSAYGREVLSRLENLTPGDYATIARRFRLASVRTGDAWIDALETECALKKSSRTRMGFCR